MLKVQIKEKKNKDYMERLKQCVKPVKLLMPCPSTVYDIIQRHRNNFQVENKSRIGQGKKLNNYDERWIFRKIKAKTFTTAMN